MVCQLTRTDLLESSTQLVREMVEPGNRFVGYIYPHIPVEIFLAHGVTPSLIRAESKQRGGFEDSLQTFACSLTRNLIAQRAGDRLLLDGIVFPGNTCDSLQNLGDVWRYRFPEDRVFRLTYPVATPDEATVEYFAEELRQLSNWLQESFDVPLLHDRLDASSCLVIAYRKALQYLYAARVYNPLLLSYSRLADLVGDFLSAPSEDTLATTEEVADAVQNEVSEMGAVDTVRSIHEALIRGSLDSLDSELDHSRKRIVVTGGMIEPRVFANLTDELNESAGADVILDLFSYGYKTTFTPPPASGGDPFLRVAESILRAPLEPTQEGLPQRKQFLEDVLMKLSADGLIVCEQSFCDPDEFEGPSLGRAGKDADIPVVRIPIDPELSDRARIETRIQTFLESVNLEV